MSYPTPPPELVAAGIVTPEGYPNYTADDGLRVRLTELADGSCEIMLTLVARRQVLINTRVFLVPPEQRADAELRYHLLQALCAFWNASGSADTLYWCVDVVLRETGGDLHLPPGWQLWSTRRAVDETQHMFREPATDRVLVISEDQFQDETTVAALEGKPVDDPEPLQPPFGLLDG